MKGFKKTGNGPRYGEFNFDRKTVEVRPHSRNLPQKKFAEGGAVGSALTKRSKPVTDLDREAGGKSPLRPGFAEGGKVGNIQAAMKAVKRMVDSGVDPDVAAKKAAAAHGVDPANLDKSATKKGMKPDPAMLAGGGLFSKAAQVVKRGMARPQVAPSQPRGMLGRVMTRAAGQPMAPSQPRGMLGRVMARATSQSMPRPITGGPTKYAKGGQAECGPVVKKAMDRHIASPKPRGHGVPSAGRRGS